MTGDKFIILATKLKNDADPSPAGYRSAASRAYYGAYHVAKSLLKDDLNRDPGTPHNEVPKWLARTQDSRAKEASVILSTLYTHRRTADYDLKDQRSETLRFATLCVSMASDIVQRLESCKADKKAMTDMVASLARFRSGPQWRP